MRRCFDETRAPARINPIGCDVSGAPKRVGGERDPGDVRVVSATHRDLRAEVNGASFRSTRFYRLP